MATDPDPGTEQNWRRPLAWIAQYLFWVVVLGGVGICIWGTSSGLSMFRYAGF